MSIAALFVIASNWKQPKCPSLCEWLNRHGTSILGILLSNKKKGTTDTHNHLDGSHSLMLSEKSQLQKVTNFDSIYIIFFK